MVQHMRRMREDGDLGEILRGAGHLFAGLAALRHRLELAHRFARERPLALPGRHRLALVRHGRARHRAAHHLALRRSADVPQDAQAAQGTDRDLRRQDAPARRLHRSARSIPKTSARWCSAWATARAAHSPPARCRRAARTGSASKSSAPRPAVAWDQERPDELWIGQRNTNNQIIVKDPVAAARQRARPYADLPGGHSEGYDDTFKQVFRRFYAFDRRPVGGARVSRSSSTACASCNSRSRTGQQRAPRLGGCSAPILAAILAIFVYGMTAAMLGTILPDLSARFRLTPRQNGTIAVAQALGLMVSSLGVGPLMDTQGRRPD